jgi:twitching motility protein PilT
MLDVDIDTVGPDPIAAAVGQTCRRNGEAHLPTSELLHLLDEAVTCGASDVHLIPGYPPTFRVHGSMRKVGEKSLTADETEQITLSLLPDPQRAQIGTSKNLDCSVAVPHNGVLCRFRASMFLSQGQWCLCLRHIPNEIPSLEWLGFPEKLAQQIAGHRNGLVIITGITGSGKTATLASLVDRLRTDTGKRILTVEEPIEYLHGPGRGGIVTQREVGRDVASFADGLKYGLRQDPDIILVGEIRDRETAQMALSAAETGHLILTTLHTRDAKGALTRLVDIFPQDTQDDVRSQLAMSLRTVVSQHLLPGESPDEKRALALEVLHVNQAAQVAIRSGKVESIESVIQTGKRDGMYMLDDDLQRLVHERKITLDTARRFAKDPDHIRPSTSGWN